MILEDSFSSHINFVDELDSNYDILLLSNAGVKEMPFSSSHLSELSFTTNTICSDSISRQQISYDYMNHKTQVAVSEHSNPIYSHIYDSSFDDGNVYASCPVGYNISIESKENVMVSPVSSPCISNLSNFENFGALYNDVQELGIDSRLSKGFREQIHESMDSEGDILEIGKSNIYMHSESISRPVLLDSFESVRHSIIHLSGLQNFAEFRHFHFVYYVLLPNSQVIQELVDIRTTPKSLILKLGQSLGLLFFILILLPFF